MKAPIVDETTSCNGCGCSMLRVKHAQSIDTHPAPFYCLHPSLVEATKVRRSDNPLTSRPAWCPLDEQPVLIVAAPRKRELVSRGVQPLTGREIRRLKRIALARGDELDAIGRVLVRPRRGDVDDVYRGALTLIEEDRQLS